MIITIDGPAGAGKSSVARALAQKLDFEMLDTGAMYRAVTFACLRAEIDLQQPGAIAALLPTLQITLSPTQVWLNGEDITFAIRSTSVTEATGAIASAPSVRTFLASLQRQYAAGRNLVTEGRDQGTIVFPQAECKFFLVAKPRERAERRLRELLARGEKITLAEVERAQAERDARDEARAIAPLKPADDAVLVDTTNYTLEEVIERLEQEARRCLQAKTHCSTKESVPSAT